MIFQKMQHVLIDIFQAFLNWNDMISGASTLHDVFKGIIKLHFIIQIVHFSKINVLSVGFGIVDFCQKESFWVFHFDGRIHVTPKFYRYHLCHVIAKPVHSFLCPEKGNISEFNPGIRDLLALPKFKMLAKIFLSKLSRKLRKIF